MNCDKLLIFADGYNSEIRRSTAKSTAVHIKTVESLEEATLLVKGMRMANTYMGGKYRFRIRARGPRQVPEVIGHYLELDWKHFSNTGQYEGTLEDYTIEMAKAAAMRGCVPTWICLPNLAKSLPFIAI